MTGGYRLHYAPDNASLIVRLTLEELGQDYETVLVDRTRQAQRSPAYLTLNPNGLIPVLETPQGPLFETGAILLWLADTHHKSAPALEAVDRGAYLKWLFFVSNTLHADLRMMFYPHLYVGHDISAQTALRKTLQDRLRTHLARLDKVAADCPGWLSADAPTGLCWYVACLLRWMALFPSDWDRSWFDLSATPHLFELLAGLENHPATRAAQVAEGLGPTPFTAPRHARPPEGSAT
ncbi:glutathione S-transferase family protein [Sedimentitalea todarodis]|uniref:Glutathione S-transferase family protein n=1 Tax=Sedimentitalea todarodis TaxID=1631240 RepID=A0ABU3VF90_9RHOB|nr:glutathione S-transferase family protein [Sedimentitalea todarodis]MDU9004846.1 glutathione S-transferase family protein [Sedimentitalea todarodis]